MKDKAIAVELTDAATLAQIAAIDGANTDAAAVTYSSKGVKDIIGSLVDGNGDLTANATTYVKDKAIAVELTDAATLAQIAKVDGANTDAAAVTYSSKGVKDAIASLLDGNGDLTANATTYVKDKAIAVELTDAATLAQIAKVDGA